MAKKPKVTSPRRGEVYLVTFDPTRGAEIKKMRPALILQNDISNRYSPITIVAAITSQFDEPPYPTEVIVRAPEGRLKSDSVVQLNQLRSIDRQRIVKRLGKITPETMERVEQALLISVGILRV